MFYQNQFGHKQNKHRLGQPGLFICRSFIENLSNANLVGSNFGTPVIVIFGLSTSAISAAGSSSGLSPGIIHTKFSVSDVSCGDNIGRTLAQTVKVEVSRPLAANAILDSTISFLSFFNSILEEGGIVTF